MNASSGEPPSNS
jgi:hypothetical protein